MGKRINVSDDLELYYKDYGSGEVIIFIPGWTCTTEFFRNNFEALARPIVY